MRGTGAGRGKIQVFSPDSISLLLPSGGRGWAAIWRNPKRSWEVIIQGEKEFWGEFLFCWAKMDGGVEREELVPDWSSLEEPAAGLTQAVPPPGGYRTGVLCGPASEGARVPAVGT